MTVNQALGHEPEKTNDRRFTAVTRSSDARGRTIPPYGTGITRLGSETSGTGVPGVDVKQPDILPLDEEDLRRAEEQDESR